MTVSPPIATAADGIVVRDCTDDDIAWVQAIYAHHVLNGLGSFEEVAPDAAEMTRRREEVVRRRLPFLVAQMPGLDPRTGTVGGYAYAGPFRPRSAYRYTVEDSVYIAPDAQGKGLGRVLLGTLIERCQLLGYRQMVAVIGDSGNFASIALHARLGFVEAGVLRSVGFKAGRWVDSVLMQRRLGRGDDTLPGR